MSYFIFLLNWLIISGLCEAFKTREFVIASRRNGKCRRYKACILTYCPIVVAYG